jgi:hypothetical protein
MKRMMVLSLVILAVCAGMSQGATFVGNSYDTGTWSGSVLTDTTTGNTAAAKYFEYNNVNISDSGYDVFVPYGAWVSDAWFTQKYTANQQFNKMDLHYSFGFVKSDPVRPNYDVYVDISTDNINWTRVWDMAGGWPAYFPSHENGNVYLTFNFGATDTLYVRHGTNAAYEAVWRIMPTWDDSNVKLYAVPEPATMVLLGLGGLLALRRKK